MEEQRLMRLLMKTCACSRRKVRADSPERPPVRGFAHILDCLREGEEMSQRQISERIGIRPQSVSEAVSLLEQRGFVCRKPSPDDRRVWLVSLTAQGRDYLEELREVRKTHAVRFFSPLDESEKETLYLLLKKLDLSQEKEGL